jgi:WD40 repeat protein
MAVIIESNYTKMVKRDVPGGNTWKILSSTQYRIWPTSKFIPNRNGSIMVPTSIEYVHEFDSTNFSSFQTYGSNATCAAFCPLEPDSFIVGYDNGELKVVSYTFNTDVSKLHCQLTLVGSAHVSACAWSQDRKWIATGDYISDIRLWDASGLTTSISIARLLPRNRSDQIASLIFVPDSTALIILCGGYLTVWDIAQGVYVANSGLPAMAMGIAFFYGPRNRVAVVVNGKISLYELRATEQKRQTKGKPSVSSDLGEFDITNKIVKSQQMLPGQNEPPCHIRHLKGKRSISSELAGFDITNKVVKSKPDSFVSVYFDIYRGVWNFDIPRAVHLVVTIKVLHPGFKPRSKTQERQDFQDVRKVNL